VSIHYKDGYKYQLHRPHSEPTAIVAHAANQRFITLAPDGLLFIREGYAWDGPSGPTVDSKTFMRGSLVHDALYQLLRLGLIPGDRRRAADRELRRICLEDGMWSVRAWWVYRSVRRFGAASASRDSTKAVLTAP
jgi:hypothetical protein